jgi:hypothetical protein
MPILMMKSQLRLDTRSENQVANEINREPVRFGDTLQVADFRRQYPNAIHRPIGPSRKYNCHGMTFAARRTWIWQADEIAKIIRDDEYEIVGFNEVLPGDVAVYYQDGDAEHSGIVVRVDRQGVVILSKWGPCHEVVHRVSECPYNAGNVIYYRIRT